MAEFLHFRVEDVSEFLSITSLVNCGSELDWELKYILEIRHLCLQCLKRACANSPTDKHDIKQLQSWSLSIEHLNS